MVYDDAIREIEQRRVSPEPLVVLLDLDRCLLDTDTLVAAFYDTLPPRLAEDVRSHQADVEMSAGSFDLIKSLRERVDDAQWDAIRQKFLNMPPHGSAYLNDGAERLMEQLRAWGVPFVIMTYGGEEWQRLKWHKAQLERTPLMIVDTKEKGRVISGWLNSDGLFAIPDGSGEAAILARRVVLVDDKVEAFVDAPARMYGIHVAFTRPIQSSVLRDDTSSSISVANGLDEVIPYIDALR